MRGDHSVGGRSSATPKCRQGKGGRTQELWRGGTGKILRNGQGRTQWLHSDEKTLRPSALRLMIKYGNNTLAQIREERRAPNRTTGGLS